MPRLRCSTRRGATFAQYLMLLFVLCLIAAFYWWKSYHGIIGHVNDLPGNTANHIAFVRQDGTATNIFLVNADGSDLRELTDDKSSKRSPSWSPDGKTICYAGEPTNSESEGKTFQIFLLGGGAPRMATYGSIGKDIPKYRPDGKMIAFLSGGAIKEMQPNGSDVRQIYPPPRKGQTPSDDSQDTGQADISQLKLPPVIQYCWAPDGSSIAAVLDLEGEAMLGAGRPQWWRKDDQSPQSAGPVPGIAEPENVALLPMVEGGEPVPLTGAGANHAGIAWYPDAVHLAVSLNTSRKTHGLLVYRSDDAHGLPEGILASAGYTVAPENPAVSPDGTKVAFEVWRMEGPENREMLGIAVLPSQPRQADQVLRIARKGDISKLPLTIRGDAHSPQWSPDGAHLLYWTFGKNGRDLWVCEANGSHPVNITRGVGDNFDAVWSPARP